MARDAAGCPVVPWRRWKLFLLWLIVLPFVPLAIGTTILLVLRGHVVVLVAAPLYALGVNVWVRASARLLRPGRPALRLTPQRLEVPEAGLSVRWQDIRSIDLQIQGGAEYLEIRAPRGAIDRPRLTTRPLLLRGEIVITTVGMATDPIALVTLLERLAKSERPDELVPTTAA